MEFNPLVSTGVVVSYLIFTLFTGLLAWKYKSTGSLEDYFIAERDMNGVVGFFSMAATLFSAVSMLGFVGYWYKFGLSTFMAIVGGYAVVVAAIYYYIGPKIWEKGRELNQITPSDLLEEHFESSYYGYIVAFFLLLAIFPYLVVQFKGVQIILELALGQILPVFWVLVTVATVIAIYTLLGGMPSVAWTDLLQGLMLLGATLIGGLFLVQTIGGGFEAAFTSLLNNNPDVLSIPDPTGVWDWKFIMTFMGAVLLGSVLRPQTWIRLHYFKDKAQVRNLSWKIPAYLLLIQFGGFCAVLAGATLIPDANPDYFLLLLYQNNFHTILFGLIAASGLAAMMSTAGSLSHSIAVVIMNDFIQKIRPDLKEKRNLLIARISSVVIIVLALWISRYDIGLIADLATAASAITAAVFFPQLLTTIRESSWATREGAIAGTVIGGSTAILFLVVPYVDPPFGIYGGFYGLAANILVFVSVSYITLDSRPEHVNSILVNKIADN